MPAPRADRGTNPPHILARRTDPPYAADALLAVAGSPGQARLHSIRRGTLYSRRGRQPLLAERGNRRTPDRGAGAHVPPAREDAIMDTSSSDSLRAAPVEPDAESAGRPRGERLVFLDRHHEQAIQG